MDITKALVSNGSQLAILAAGITVVLIVVFLNLFFSSKKVIIRAFKKDRKKAINSIKENNYAKVIGIAKYINTPLIAPLSGRPCVYYHVIVSVKVGKNWRRVINDINAQDFFIETNTEKAIVKALALEKNTTKYYLVKKIKDNSNFRNNIPPVLQNYLKQHSNKNTNFLGITKTIRYTERVIEIDEKIGVKGIAKWKTITAPIKGYSYSKILTLEGTKKEKLLITNEPKALTPVKNKM